MDKKIEEKEEEKSVFMAKTERSGTNCVFYGLQCIPSSPQKKMMMKKKKKKENNIYLSRVPVQLGASRWRVYSRMRDGDVNDGPLKIMNNKYTHERTDGRTRACIV